MRAAWFLLLVSAAAGAFTSSVCPAFPLNCTIPLPANGRVAVGDCVLPGAACTGDTVIELFDASTGRLLSRNDDGYNTSACGLCSYLEFTDETGLPRMLTLTQACAQAQPCDGVTAFSVSGGEEPVVSVAQTESLDGSPPPAASPPPTRQASSSPLSLSLVLLIVGVVIASVALALVLANCLLQSRVRRRKTDGIVYSK